MIVIVGLPIFYHIVEQIADDNDRAAIKKYINVEEVGRSYYLNTFEGFGRVSSKVTLSTGLEALLTLGSIVTWVVIGLVTVFEADEHAITVQPESLIAAVSDIGVFFAPYTAWIAVAIIVYTTSIFILKKAYKLTKKLRAVSGKVEQLLDKEGAA